MMLHLLRGKQELSFQNHMFSELASGPDPAIAVEPLAGTRLGGFLETGRGQSELGVNFFALRPPWLV